MSFTRLYKFVQFMKKHSISPLDEDMEITVCSTRNGKSVHIKIINEVDIGCNI